MTGRINRRRSFRATALLLALTALAFGAMSGASAQSARHSTQMSRVPVIAVETFYGSMLGQIGGPYVQVTSLLDNPNADPHQFEASAQAARELSAARLVVKNGIGYDGWVDKLLGASPRSGRIVISVGELLGHHSGDNPHVWYDPNGWTREAEVMEGALARLDPRHRAVYKRQEAQYLRALLPLRREIAHIRSRAHGAPVTATEPVFGYMAQALGLQMRNLDFQKAVMDGTDPSPQSVAHFEDDLNGRKVRVLFYNSQTSSPITLRMRSIAQQHHIPVVGVSELAPRNRTFQAWQLGQLQAVARALKV